MKKIFLYIDILGFEKLVRNKSSKVDKIFKIIDELNVHRHFALKTIVFSDTILVFNKSEDHQNHYYVTYLIEYVQELFYKLSNLNIYFKGLITLGEFNFSKLNNIDAYYGLALIDTYKDESKLEGFGLYVDKKITNDIVVFDKIKFDEKYDFVLLCQSLILLYEHTNGKLPIDTEILFETDTFYRIDEDLRFLREIEYLKNEHPVKKIKDKYQKVYEIYKSATPEFFKKFEKEGFLPFTLNPDYPGNINPFEILAEIELNKESD